MKKITFILFALISGSVFAQASANATASAEIVSAIAITKNSDLKFGTVAPSNSATTLKINASDGTVDATNSTAKYIGTDQGAASFKISAANNFSYAVTVPGTVSLDNEGAGVPMTVDLTHSLSEIADADDVLTVGGTLNIGASQATGTYTGTFKVSVAYE